MRSLRVHSTAFRIALAVLALIPLQVRAESRTLTHFVAPAYPPLARSSRIVGRVNVTATAKKDGTVSVTEVSGAHELLLTSVRNCVSEWRFSRSGTEQVVLVTIYFGFSGVVRGIFPSTTVIADFEGGSITIYVTTDPPPQLMP